MQGETNLKTPEAVAERLGVSPWTVRKWFREGVIPGVKVGSLIRFRPEDVEAFIEASRTGKAD